MKFGYFFDEAGNCHIQNEEAAVVRFVFTRYANDHKPIDVLSYDLPREVSPGVLGGKEWRRRHVHSILSDPTYAGIQASPTGFVPGRYLPIIPLELFIAAQEKRTKRTNPSYRERNRDPLIGSWGEPR